jgi:hypothetical protein
MKKIQKRSKRSADKDTRKKSMGKIIMKKKNLPGKIIPRLIRTEKYNMNYLFQPSEFLGLGILYSKLHGDKITPLKVSDLKKFKCKFDDIVKKSNTDLEKNIYKVNLKTSKYPHNHDIFSVMGICATSVLFTKWPEQYWDLGPVVLMPVYEDFIVCTRATKTEELIEFYRIASSMAFAAEKQNKLLSKELFTIDPRIGKLEKLNTLKLFGSNFDLVSIDGTKDIEPQLNKYASTFAAKMLMELEGKEKATSIIYANDAKFTMLRDKIKGDLASELLKANLGRK